MFNLFDGGFTDWNGEKSLHTSAQLTKSERKTHLLHTCSWSEQANVGVSFGVSLLEANQYPQISQLAPPTG